MKRIVVPVDFSPAATQAAEYAAEFAAALGASLELIHVVPKFLEERYQAAGNDVFGGLGDFDWIHHQAGPALQSVLEDARQKLGAVSGVRASGKVVGEIVRHTEEAQTDLLIVAKHGRSGLRERTLGSVASKLVRLATCPVLVVPESTEPELPGPEHPILVGTDFSTASESAAQVAGTLATHLHAEVHMLHVFDPPASYYDVALRRPVMIDHAVMQLELEEALHKHAAAVRSDQVQVHADLTEGNAIDELLAASKKRRVAVLAVGATGSTALERILLGGTTERLLRLSRAPVLVAR